MIYFERSYGCLSDWQGDCLCHCQEHQDSRQRSLYCCRHHSQLDLQVRCLSRCRIAADFPVEFLCRYCLWDLLVDSECHCRWQHCLLDLLGHCHLLPDCQEHFCCYHPLHCRQLDCQIANLSHCGLANRCHHWQLEVNQVENQSVHCRPQILICEMLVMLIPSQNLYLAT
nr:hypothetical protein BaRGS_027987 [Batillaria attramentaria]